MVGRFECFSVWTGCWSLFAPERGFSLNGFWCSDELSTAQLCSAVISVSSERRRREARANGSDLRWCRESSSALSLLSKRMGRWDGCPSSEETQGLATETPPTLHRQLVIAAP